MDPSVIGTWVAVALTLMVMSYVLGDNPLYKLAEHIFVGASVGWTFVLLYRSVLLGKLFYELQRDPVGNFSLLVPLLLGLLLLFRPLRPIAWLGDTPLAFVVGAGAALAIVGASAGLLIPQAVSTILPVIPTRMDWDGWRESLSNLTVVVGVVATFLYFHFTGKQLGRFGKPLGMAAGIGRYAMMIAFGALFAGVALSRLSFLAGRINFLFDAVLK